MVLQGQRKLLRKQKMKQLKLAVGLLLLSGWCFLMVLIYWYRPPLPDHKIKSHKLKGLLSTEGYIRHIFLDDIYPVKHYPNDSYELNDHKKAHMIHTAGCKIPVSFIRYDKSVKSDKKPVGTCGKRAVFIKKIGRDKVQALIKPKIMKKYLRKSVIFDCCYRFMFRSAKKNQGKKIRFSKCVKFNDSKIITLEADFVNVKCFEYDKRNTSHIIYDDSYAFTRGKNVPNDGNCSDNYNVLLIGIDSMSLPRFVQALSRTGHYFKDNLWLGYRGYHKIGDNTLPNLMAVLTGKDLTTITKKCSGKMDECHKYLIWNEFKNAGYVTAYGEDYLRLPDTFANKYAFKMQPTDHYMRPFFIKGETELNNKSLVCVGRVPSVQQVLNYALDFANTYRSNKFFGLFWLNSISHNVNSRPQDADIILENFLNQLSYTGIFRNTFVIVFSDHGIRFGEHRLKVESYYDERLPFLFILPPGKFKERHKSEVKAMTTNQFRLVTPYDMYNTFVGIHKISTCLNKTAEVLEACPNCHSIFRTINSNRTCQDVVIDDKWCSCHNLYPLPLQDSEGEKGVQTAVSHIKTLIKSVKTKKCWGCVNLSLKNIIRIHFYSKEDKMSWYYVVAFTMTPSNVSYEATVLFRNGTRTVVGSVSVITPYRGLGKCTIKPKDRLFCFCQRVENCS